MAYLSGKQAFLEILKTEGVSVMFGNPGTTELPLMDGLAREPGIRYVLALQEAVAISMADAYAQAHGGLAAVNVHVSPGLGNAMGMLYDAYKAHSPLLLTAGQHDQSFTLAELVELAELIGAPVMLEGVSSTCSFPFTHPLYAGSMPRLGPGIKGLLMRHDLLFSVGGDLFTLSLPSDVDPMPPGLDVVHLDVDPWELGKNYPAAVAIQGDPKASLPELIEAVRRHAGKAGHRDAGRRREALAARHARERDDLARRAADEARESPMGPLALVHAVSQVVPDDVVVVDEAISSSAGIRNFFRCADARSFFSLRGGGIGWGLPAALGVKLALPRRPVVALVGDGSAMYTAQALWTAAHESLAVVYVIFNNASYRILKERTKALKGFSAEDDRYVAMDLVDPLIDYIGLAKSLGVVGEHVEKAADVGPAVGRALASGAPALIDVRIDPSFT